LSERRYRKGVSAGTRICRLLSLAALMFVMWTTGPAIASARSQAELRPHLCFTGEPAAAARPRSPACDKALRAGSDGWTWSRLDDPRRLDALPAAWHLLLPHRQLDAVTVVIAYRDGTVTRLARTGGALAVDWSPSGHASFVSPRPGRDVAALAIGYKGTNARSALRYVTAVPAALYEKRAADFRLVVGLFVGAVASALIYNLFIGVGVRHAFHRIYIVWSVLALANGLLASGLLEPLWPALAGPVGILANRFVLAGLYASGILFLLALIEPGLLSRTFIRVGMVASAAMALAGPLAAAEPWLPAGMPGLFTNAVTALGIVVIFAVAVTAARRGSRAVWFYLAGWAPILMIGMVMVGYDLGALPHSPLIDLGGMLAIAFETVILSLAIADRFRHLQRDHDQLEHARVVAEADRAALQRVADTDQLTGLGNRRVFEAALAGAKEGQLDRLALILIDVDHFKSVNDRLGHESGDELLASIAQQIRANVRANDVVARLGGDEFAILLKGADARHAGHVIRGLLAARRHAAPSLASGISFSIGAALFPDDDPDPAHLYKNADLALYEAKRLGRARSHHYAPVLRRRDEYRLSVG
jgi:diguanylate cyclase (GGDEF)-like protein